MQILERFDSSLISECRESGEYVWIDLLAPQPHELEEIGRQLDWNPLLVEDLDHGGQRPKVEDFADHVLVICYGAEHDAVTSDIVLREQGIVVHGDYLVTVRPAPDARIDHLRHALRDNAAGVSEAAVLHRVLDLIVDTTMDASDIIAADVDRLEIAIDNESSDEIRDGLRSCRRDLVTLRSVVVAQRDALDSLAAALEAIPGFDVGMRSHFRDVFDHAWRVVDRLEVRRDLLDAAFDAYNTMLIARQGLVAQRLTVIATIFLPLTFVTGFFGQNFSWMVQSVASRADFFIFGVGATVTTAAILAGIFWRMRWW